MPVPVKKMRLADLLPKHKLVLDPRSHRMPHPTYDVKDIETIPITHRDPTNLRDRFALATIRMIRSGFDLLTGYNETRMSERLWLNRVIFLETIAGVPGMCGGMTLHLKTLRTLKPDRGLLHYLLEEAENERTHLFIFMNYKNPGYMFRGLVALS